jgi:hypothetical protein
MNKMQTGKAIGPVSPGVIDLQIQNMRLSFDTETNHLNILFRSAYFQSSQKNRQNP